MTRRRLLAGVLAALALGGAALLLWPRRPPLCVVCGDCPYVYQLNPALPDVGPQGLRDRAYPVPKPPGRKRILILGDSVTYGGRVDRDQTFAKVLERRLDGVDVINAGVPGYTPWNELQYYLARGRRLEPDLVLVGVCLNDLAEPLHHWSGSPELNAQVPPAAIPNPARRVGGPWREPPALEIDGRRYFVFVTGESDLPIQVWLDPESPEWRWLRGIYGQLIDAVHGDGGEVALVLLPLRYQLAQKGHPFRPQEEIQRYCRRAGILCADLSPALDQPVPTMADPWHLNRYGHELVAGELLALLRAHPRLLAR